MPVHAQGGLTVTFHHYVQMVIWEQKMEVFTMATYKIVSHGGTGLPLTVEGNMSGSVTTSIVKNASYDASGYSSTFGRIVYIGKNS